MFENESHLIRSDELSIQEQGLTLYVESMPIKFFQEHGPGLGSQVGKEPLPGRLGTLEEFVDCKKREIHPNS